MVFGTAAPLAGAAPPNTTSIPIARADAATTATSLRRKPLYRVDSRRGVEAGVTVASLAGDSAGRRRRLTPPRGLDGTRPPAVVSSGSPGRRTKSFTPTRAVSPPQGKFAHRTMQELSPTVVNDVGVHPNTRP